MARASQRASSPLPSAQAPTRWAYGAAPHPAGAHRALNTSGSCFVQGLGVYRGICSRSVYCTATSGAVITSPTPHLQQCPVSALKGVVHGRKPGGRFGSEPDPRRRHNAEVLSGFCTPYGMCAVRDHPHRILLRPTPHASTALERPILRNCSAHPSFKISSAFSSTSS